MGDDVTEIPKCPKCGADVPDFSANSRGCLVGKCPECGKWGNLGKPTGTEPKLGAAAAAPAAINKEPVAAKKAAHKKPAPKRPQPIRTAAASTAGTGKGKSFGDALRDFFGPLGG